MRSTLVCDTCQPGNERWDWDSFLPPLGSAGSLCPTMSLISLRLPSSPSPASPPSLSLYDVLVHTWLNPSPRAFTVSPSCCRRCVNISLPPRPQLFLHRRIHAVTSKRESSRIDSRLRVVGVRKRNNKQRTAPCSSVKSSPGESLNSAPINQTCYFFPPHHGDFLHALRLRLKTRDR